MGFRYHVTTIVSIFLALALGIVIGSQFVQSAIVAKQTRDVGDLRIQFKEQIVTLTDENARYQSFAAAVLRNQKLPGLKMSIIQTGDYSDTTARVKETLDQAGAAVSGTMVISPSAATKIGGDKNTIGEQLRAAHPGLPADSSAVWQTIAAMLARGAQEADLKLLREANLIQTDGDFTKPVEYVVMVGGASETFDNRADAVDVPLIRELKAQGLKVVAVEPEKADISYVQNLRNNEIATVDNVDTDMGRVALVLAVHAAPGNYGSKKTARDGSIPSTRGAQ